MINELSNSLSPYLQQHADNPIAWQEYSEEAIRYAEENDLPIFLSIGYATCHWCHVMAADTFSNETIADYVNENFVAIKIDREQRPDIDSFCMDFIQRNYGQGGWPLNIVMTPDLKPFFACTYVGSEPKYNMPGFLDVMTKVLDFYRENKDSLTTYSIDNDQIPIFNEVDLEIFRRQIDRENHGFKGQNKFPPHCSLLYLLSNDEVQQDTELYEFTKNTLIEMQNSGLADQVGGGFFRYCVDSQWQIPHFEKMLYDQAMMLINYTLGYARFQDERFLKVIERLLFCLEDTFLVDGLYISGHDADTDHEEGLSYLWSKKEIEDVLGSESSEFFASFELIPFEGKFHLAKVSESEIGFKLYGKRKGRRQPEADTKILTSWNALLGIAFCFVERYTNIRTPIEVLYKSLEKQKNTHSTRNGVAQSNYFLEDAASFLLLQTYLFELGLVTKEDLKAQKNEVDKFFIENRWIENPNSDFLEVAPQEFDHPIPSSESMRVWSLIRYSILFGDSIDSLDYKMPSNFDAYNYAVMFAREHSHIKSMKLPAAVPFLYLFEQSDENTICRYNSCIPID